MTPTVETRGYVFDALQRTYTVLAPLLKRVPDGSWDEPWHPERFTMREMAAHIADWDLVWRDRIERTRTGVLPQLPRVDEEAMAKANDYASADPMESLRQFGMRRRELVRLIGTLGEEEWKRSSIHPRVGTVTMFELVTLIVCHDMYHIQEASFFLSCPRM